MVPTARMDRTAVKKVKLNVPHSDFTFWQRQSYEMRLATLEEIRQEYIKWAYDSKQGFQRVYTIIKQNKYATGRHQDLADIENLS